MFIQSGDRTKVEHHRNICKKLNETYERKNHDYGDSFHKSYLEEGLAMARIRLGDKYSRFCTLSKAGSVQKVDDESVIDTLLDMANYAIMTVMELSEGTEDGATVGSLEKNEHIEYGWSIRGGGGGRGSSGGEGSASPVAAFTSDSIDTGISTRGRASFPPEDLLAAYIHAMRMKEDKCTSFLYKLSKTDKK